MAESALETALLEQIMKAGLPEPEREFVFAPPRRWRADFIFLDRKVMVECEGGVWNRGRHLRPSGFEGDCQKYNEAALQGWLVLRFTPGMIRSGEALASIHRALRKEN
jgi:very-short-patch-repair endonuclease